MSENKITIEEAIKQISEGFSSIYSKDDVLHLLSVIEVNDDIEFDESEIRDLSADIANELGDNGTRIVDDYELSMNGREVELDSIDFNTSDIRDIVEDTLKHYLSTRKEEAAA